MHTIAHSASYGVKCREIVARSFSAGAVEFSARIHRVSHQRQGAHGAAVGTVVDIRIPVFRSARRVIHGGDVVPGLAAEGDGAVDGGEVASQVHGAARHQYDADC